MKTLQDALDKTNRTYPHEKLKTRSIRETIVKELFYVSSDTKLWFTIPIDEDLDKVLSKYL